MYIHLGVIYYGDLTAKITDESHRSPRCRLCLSSEQQRMDKQDGRLIPEKVTMRDLTLGAIK